ncbi:Hint domain-containing protein [Bordetella sp. BOR01]|uniref:Hint domain-containing protein n=1 Tax=Bordetella sp. BOR01 TaxID=2854779 RepID=UPI001C455E13|nr:Hint domain-containing protein [Bordetella sp. BOR01]MBV7486201.1 Hint domain-containing protein [Bordetella sp. BOR01]
MATIDLNLGGLGNPTNGTVDQSTYDGDTLLNINAIGSTNLTVTNTTNSPDVLELQQTIGLGVAPNNTVNLGENAHVALTGLAGANLIGTFNYNLSAGSTLDMSSAFLNVGLANTINVNMDGTGASTFIYDATGINLNLSGYPNITGVTEGDQIQVANATSGEYSGGDLIFRDSNGIVVGRFNADGLDPDLVTFSGGTMTYACYLKGTHIATPEGETKVEELKAGDKVLTASGGVATVKWLGYRTLRKVRIPAKDAVRAFPVVFQKGSIAENVPHRELTLSPGHHVYFDGKLIPAMMLVNGKTITQDFSRQVFEYFHVELDRFDILLAEGAPAESYVDTGNRSMFQNADTVSLSPDFGPAEGRPKIDGIQVLRSGPEVEAVRKRLLKRAEALTQSVRVSDPLLRVETNGVEIRAETEGQLEGVMRFVLPAGVQASDLRILSRSAVVRDTTAHARRDLREVGVGLVRMTIEDGAGRRDIDLLDSRLSGLHNPQDVHGATMRWTNGAAVIPAAVHGAQGQAVLELHVLRTYSYWAEQKRAA